MASNTISLSLSSEMDTFRLGEKLSVLSKRGDCILLRGHIGSGKSALVRAFIRQRLGPDAEVPSPTFTLVQTYITEDTEIWHADLYRLSDTQEAIELGLIDAFADHICLIEWPELLGDLAPENALTIDLEARAESHLAVLSFGSYWSDRLKDLSIEA